MASGIKDSKFSSIPAHINNQLFEEIVIRILDIIVNEKMGKWGRELKIIKKKKDLFSLN